MNEKQKQDIENCIHSIITSNPIRMTIRDLDRDFKSTIGYAIPFRQLGFPTLEVYLRSIPHRVIVRGSGMFAELQPVASNKSAHLDELISRQRIPSKKPHMKYLCKRTTFQQQQLPTSSNSVRPLMSFKIKTPDELIASNQSPSTFKNSNVNNFNNHMRSECVKIEEHQKDERKQLYEEVDDSTVPLPIRERMIAIVDRHPEGVLCRDIPKIYESMYGKSFNYTKFGYRSVAHMYASITNLFTLRQMKNGDMKIYKASSDVPTIVDESPPRQPVEEKETCTEPALPDDIDDIVLAFHRSDLLKNNIKLITDIPHMWYQMKRKVDDYIDVNVTHVYDPSKFWFNITSYVSDLNRVMDEMQLFYNENKPKYQVPFFALKEGLYVAALWHNEFQRGKIINISKKNQSIIKVFFIDYGTVSNIYVQHVCYLDVRFSTFPAQAFRGRLFGIYPIVKDEPWTSEASMKFLSLVKSKTLVSLIMDVNDEQQVFDVILADTSEPDEDFYINDALVFEKFAKFTNEPQDKAKDKKLAPIVKWIHLYPTHEEIEEDGSIPNPYEMLICSHVNVTMEKLLPQYFVPVPQTEERNNGGAVSDDGESLAESDAHHTSWVSEIEEIIKEETVKSDVSLQDAGESKSKGTVEDLNEDFELGCCVKEIDDIKINQETVTKEQLRSDEESFKRDNTLTEDVVKEAGGEKQLRAPPGLENCKQSFPPAAYLCENQRPFPYPNAPPMMYNNVLLMQPPVYAPPFPLGYQQFLAQQAYLQLFSQLITPMMVPHPTQMPSACTLPVYEQKERRDYLNKTKVDFDKTKDNLNKTEIVGVGVPTERSVPHGSGNNLHTSKINAVNDVNISNYSVNARDFGNVRLYVINFNGTLYFDLQEFVSKVYGMPVPSARIRKLLASIPGVIDIIDIPLMKYPELRKELLQCNLIMEGTEKIDVLPIKHSANVIKALRKNETDRSDSFLQSIVNFK